MPKGLDGKDPNPRSTKLASHVCISSIWSLSSQSSFYSVSNQRWKVPETENQSHVAKYCNSQWDTSVWRVLCHVNDMSSYFIGYFAAMGGTITQCRFMKGMQYLIMPKKLHPSMKCQLKIHCQDRTISDAGVQGTKWCLSTCKIIISYFTYNNAKEPHRLPYRSETSPPSLLRIHPADEEAWRFTTINLLFSHEVGLQSSRSCGFCWQC